MCSTVIKNALTLWLRRMVLHLLINFFELVICFTVILMVKIQRGHTISLLFSSFDIVIVMVTIFWLVLHTKKKKILYPEKSPQCLTVHVQQLKVKREQINSLNCR